MPKKRPSPSSRRELVVPKAPVWTLALLFAAFAGALALKALDERQMAANAAMREARHEADAQSGLLRGRLAVIEDQIGDLSARGAKPAAIERQLGLSSVSANSGPAPTRFDGKDEITLIADGRSGRWLRAKLSASSVLTEPPRGAITCLVSDPSRSLDASGARAEYRNDHGPRHLVACAAVPDAAFNLCVSRPAPWVSSDDYYRILIYVLLLAAPLLALYGLLNFARVQRLALEHARPAPAKGASSEVITVSKDMEIAGLMGVWRWDASTRVLTLGKTSAELLGRSGSRSMQITEFLSGLLESDRDRIEAALLNADPFAGLQTQFRVSRLGQPVKHFEMFGGLYEGVFSGALLDVTDRVAAQTLSKRAEAVARMALEAHPGPFAVWDSRRRLTHWNSAFLRTFNLDPGVLHIGASFDYVMSEVSKYVRVERPLGDDSKSRELFLASEQWVRMIDRRTANDGMITVGLDITALKTQEADLSRNERKLRSMISTLERTKGQAQELAERYAEQKIKAERASHAKSAFLANMSHELRTPLNAILGFSEMIANEVYGPLGDQRYQGYATDILESGRHLLEMINDVLDMAKIEAGKMQIAPRQIDATDAVDSAVRLIRRRASDKGVSLTLDHDDGLPDIHGDHRAIKQMTLNLIANAIKFTPSGGRIDVRVRRQEPWMVISVADTGVGIHAADLPRIGQPFEQARSPDGQSHGGTGLGLAITKSFAEMHGGKLQIESEVGVGTTVSIFLPLNEPDTSGVLSAAE